MADEAELTRKAIAEIMRDMDAQREADKMPIIQERKKNPLGRPNKDFLDRTLNSVMTHNKRETDRNYRNCQRQLRALDSGNDRRIRPSRPSPHHYNRKERKKRRHSDTSESSRSISSDRVKKRKKKKSKKIKKKKKHKKQQLSTSSSSTSSTISSSSEDSDSAKSNDSHRKYKKHKENDYHTDNAESATYYQPELAAEHDPNIGFYVNPNMALAMAYNHMNQLIALQQQQSVQELLKEELENNEDKDIPSDLSLTHYTTDESELNVSLNSSSAEELNGILTFNLSSDEEKKRKKVKKTQARSMGSKRLTSRSNPPTSESESCDNDRDSIQSHISLESDGSSVHRKTSEFVEVSILSSSSDSDCQEVVEIVGTEVKVDRNVVGHVDFIESKDLESTPVEAGSVSAKVDESVNVNDDGSIKTIEHHSKEDTSLKAKENLEAALEDGPPQTKENEDSSLAKAIECDTEIEFETAKEDELIKTEEHDLVTTNDNDSANYNSIEEKVDQPLKMNEYESANDDDSIKTKESLGIAKHHDHSEEKEDSVKANDNEALNVIGNDMAKDNGSETAKDQCLVDAKIHDSAASMSEDFKIAFKHNPNRNNEPANDIIVDLTDD